MLYAFGGYPDKYTKDALVANNGKSFMDGSNPDRQLHYNAELKVSVKRPEGLLFSKCYKICILVESTSENMTRISKPSLRKLMKAHEKAIKQLKDEFLSNEVNDPKNLHLCLQKAYEEIEPVYKEIMNRYSKPMKEAIPSKINLEKDSYKTLTYQWDL